MLSSPVQNVEVNLYAHPTQNVSINFRFVADDSDDRKRTRDGSFRTSTHHLAASQQDDEEEIIQRSFDRLDRIDANFDSELFRTQMM